MLKCKSTNWGSVCVCSPVPQCCAQTTPTCNQHAQVDMPHVFQCHLTLQLSTPPDPLEYLHNKYKRRFSSFAPFVRLHTIRKFGIVWKLEALSWWLLDFTYTINDRSVETSLFFPVANMQSFWFLKGRMRQKFFWRRRLSLPLRHLHSTLHHSNLFSLMASVRV